MNIDPASHEEKLKQAERIAFLIAGHLKGTLTNEEADELDNWITASDENLELFENLTDEDNIEHAMQQYLQAEKQKQGAFNELKETIHPGKKTKKFRPWQFVVAASLLLIAGSAYFISYNKQYTPNEKLVGQKKAGSGEIQAGSDKAVLTLSDGRAVILGSADGHVISDAGVDINQTKNGQLIYAGTTNEMAYNTIATPRGGQFQVVLGDGTKVRLNADSYLKYPVGIATGERRVELKGEAYFEVAKNADRPFTVQLPEQGGAERSVQVLGTHFNVNGYAEETAKVTLLEGSVRVRANGTSKLLQPGQQASLAGNVPVNPIDVAEAIAWKDGKFLFRDATVQSIAAQIRRWYDVDVRIEGNIDQQFNMEISRNVPLSRLLAGLEKTGAIHFSMSEKTLTIKP